MDQHDAVIQCPFQFHVAFARAAKYDENGVIDGAHSLDFTQRRNFEAIGMIEQRFKYWLVAVCLDGVKKLAPRRQAVA
jgi:hypothetical protein